LFICLVLWVCRVPTVFGISRIVWFTTCAIIAYHHYGCEYESLSWRGVLDTTLCDKVCQWLATDGWFYAGTPVSSTNTIIRHDLAEILLKVALNTIPPHSNIPVNRFLLSTFHSIQQASCILQRITQRSNFKRKISVFRW
jgi:hypothetical protein